MLRRRTGGLSSTVWWATLIVTLAASGCRTITRQQVLSQPPKAAVVEIPRIPPPSPFAAEVPAGYRVEIVASGLTLPSSIEFDDAGTMYIAEAGFAYGDMAAPARVMRVDSAGRIEVVADQLNGPITDLLWHGGQLYISQQGKVSVLRENRVEDIVTGLPSLGDCQNNQLTVGPDGKIYVGEGTASNSGVVGPDNYAMGWLGQHPGVYDVLAKKIELRSEARFSSVNPLKLSSEKEKLSVETGPLQPFGQAGATHTTAEVKANGTVLCFNEDGSGLETYAWGFRNPFGVAWGLDGILYVAEDGYDERGSRPIANAPDVIWQVKKGGWYGFPDFAGGIPVTDARFKPSRGPVPEFLLKRHPKRPEQPLAKLAPHSGVAKMDFSRNSQFGYEGQIFVCEAGDMQPLTGNGLRRVGFQVARIDPFTGETAPFFRTRQDSLGGKGVEYVATAGPKRPVDARFSREGDALYVADIGAIMVSGTATPSVRPFASTGVIWRISRESVEPKFPIGISFVPGKGNDAVGGTATVVEKQIGAASGVAKRF